MSNKKISQLPTVTNAAVGDNSIVPLVDSTDSVTKTISLAQLDERWASTVAPTQQILTAGIYTFTVTSANATLGDTYTNNGQTFTVLKTISNKTALICSGTGRPSNSGTLTKSAGSGDSSITFSSYWGSPASGTYVPPNPAPLYAKARILAAGGGGAGGGQLSGGGTPGSDGSDGGDTNFGSFVAAGGKGGSHNGPGGAGGYSDSGIGLGGFAIQGGGGGAGDQIAADPSGGGGVGGSSALGGGGQADGDNTAAGGDGAFNSGAGGGGGGVASLTTSTLFSSGSGGGAGEYIEVKINSPGSILYNVGTGGSGGAAGSRATAGGNGGSGIIIIDEYYQ